MGRGSKPKNTDYFIINERPSRQDDASNSALNGDNQMKFSYYLEKAGIDRKKVYFSYALKCTPKETSNIKNKHLDECRKYLFQEIITHKPKVIIAMGRWAFQAVSDMSSIREFRGHFHYEDFTLDYEVEVNGKIIEKTFTCKILPTWSLNGSIAKWEWSPDVISDYKKARKYVEKDFINKSKEPELNVILTKSGLNDFVEKYREVKFATTDFETTGFDFWRHRIINAGYATKDGIADIIYLEPYKREHMAKGIKKKGEIVGWEAIWDKENIERAKQINSFLKHNRNKCIEALKTVNSFKHLKLILHNGKFDAQFAIENGMPYKNFFFDTLIADSLIDENLGHSLNIAMERRGIDYGAYDTLLWKYTNKDEKKKKSYQFIPPLLIERYLGIDVWGDFQLFQKQIKELKDEDMWNHMFERKMPIVKDLIKCEYRGVKADKKLFMKASKLIQKTQDKINLKLADITGQEDFNPNSPKQIVDYMVDAGYPFKRLQIKETKSGFSTGKDELEKFLKFKKWKEFPQLILNAKKLSKLKGTYVDGKDGKGGMVQYLDSKNRIHTTFNIWTPRTSRWSCFAKGTKIEIVRNHTLHPKGINIEDVKVGDLAYCYDNKGKLTIKPVKSVFSNGTKRVRKLYWVSSAGRIGSVDVTPDHKFKIERNGNVFWCRADLLERDDKFFFLSRKNGASYEFLMHTNSEGGGDYEHVFVQEQLRGPVDRENNHVHHIDHDSRNNLPENLVEWDKERHKRHHAKIWSATEEHKKRSSEQLKEKWKNNRQEMLKIMPRGEDHSDYKGWSKIKILKIIMKAGCRAKYTGYDYYTIQKYLKLHNLNWKELKDRFTHEGDFIPTWKIYKCLNEEFTIEQVKSFLRIGQDKWYRLKERYQIETNHKFVALVEEGKEVEVFDLEIEDHHNYIANEICAHNCNRPSLQVWPRPIKGLPNTRQAIIPTNKQWCLFEADYSQLEQCVVAWLSKDVTLIKRIQDGMDLHCINAADIGRVLKTVPSWVTYEHMLLTNDKANKIADQAIIKELEKDIEKHGQEINWKEKRTQAKNIGFGLNYGKSAITFAEDFGIDIEESEEMVDAYFKIYSGMKNWRDSQVEQALKEGFVNLISERKRRFHHAIDWFNSSYSEDLWITRKQKEEIARQAMNAPVQGGAHDIFESACIRLNRRFRKEKLKARILLYIHDGIVGECPIEELAFVNKIILEEMPITYGKGTKHEVKFKIDTDFYKWEWYGEKIKL
jgi:uracil-DNA glycosylase family 4